MYREEIEQILASKVVSLDFETDGLVPYEATPVGASIGWKVDGKYRAKYWTLDFIPHGKNKVSWRWFNRNLLEPIWKDPEKTLVMHNSKYDLQVAIRRRAEYPLASGDIYGELPKCRVEDTMVMSFLVDENIPRRLKELSRIYLKKPRATYEQVEAQISATLRQADTLITKFLDLGWKLYQAVRDKKSDQGDLFSDLGELDQNYRYAEVLSAWPVMTKSQFAKKFEAVVLDDAHEYAMRVVGSQCSGGSQYQLLKSETASFIKKEVSRGWDYVCRRRLNPAVMTKFDSLVLNMPPGLKKEDFVTRFRSVIAPGIQRRCQAQADELMCKYGEEDASDTLILFDILHPRLCKDEKIKQWYYDVELPFHLLMVEMEIEGVTLDVALLKMMERDASYIISRKFKALQERVRREHGIVDFNPRSHAQIKDLFWNKMRLKAPKWARVTASGMPSTDSEVLKYLAEQGHDLCSQLLELNGVSKLHGTYLKPLLKRGSDNFRHKIRTSYNSVGPVTGRVSSSDPNLQNQPNADKMPRLHEQELEAIYSEIYKRRIRFSGKEPYGWSRVKKDGEDTPYLQMVPLRRAFMAPPGYTLIVFDYSQIELRGIAHISNDKRMVEAYTTWKCECGATGRTEVAIHKCPACGAADGELDVLDPKQPVKHGFCLGLDLHSMTGVNVGLCAKYGPSKGRKKSKPVNFGQAA